MTIQDAIRSGKPFRRSIKATRFSKDYPLGIEVPVWRWIVSTEENFPALQLRYSANHPENIDRTEVVALNATDILADDWELKDA